MKFPSAVLAGILSIGALYLLSAQDGPESVIAGTKRFRKSVLATGMAGPWEVTWGPDNMLWVTERTGKRVTRIDPQTGKRHTAVTVGEVSAPGGQDGLLGMALHPELLRGTGHDYVYLAYTYIDNSRGPNPWVSDDRSPYRHLYGKIARYTYDPASETLSHPQDVISGLPAGNDHVSGRLKIGPDRKLYFTVGDGGHNQLGNYCLPILAQRLPTREETSRGDYVAYAGKSLRINLDGSIPADNPKLAGVVSHVYTYGHRNMQGIDFAPDGTLYASEQGPKTDDEINILKAGGNYGWPYVAGFRDGKAYEYARWADSQTACPQLQFSDFEIPPSVPRSPESAFTAPFVEPIATMFTVPTGYNFRDPACKGVDFICWPTVAASSIEYYPSKTEGIPGWDRVLLVTTLKRGSLYVLPLRPDGQSAAGHFWRYFQTENRYRDTAVSGDGKTIYVATDPEGVTEALAGGAVFKMQNPGAILAFTYEGEGAASDSARAGGESGSDRQPAGSGAEDAQRATGPRATYARSQASAGKAAYESNCAVCHGNTLTNGTFAPPLAGEYFRNKWSGRAVGGLYDRVKSMPPSAPSSLPDQTYAEILAYVLQKNGVPAGTSALPANRRDLDGLVIP